MAAVERVLSIAAGEVGVKESPAGSNRVKYNTWFYGRKVSGASYPWCCVFVCWVFREAGLDNLLRKTGGCTTMLNWFKARGRIVPAKEAKPGDVVFYQFDTDSYADHVGIVERVSTGGVVAIEGNTSMTSEDNGGAVMRRSRGWNRIMAVARPDYESVKEEREMAENETAQKRYQSLAELPEWAREAVKSLADQGVLQGGEDGRLDLSLDMVRMLVVLARLKEKAGEAA